VYRGCRTRTRTCGGRRVRRWGRCARTWGRSCRSSSTPRCCRVSWPSWTTSPPPACRCHLLPSLYWQAVLPPPPPLLPQQHTFGSCLGLLVRPTSAEGMHDMQVPIFPWAAVPHCWAELDGCLPALNIGFVLMTDHDGAPPLLLWQAHASAAVVNFSESCEQELLPPYLDTLISKLLTSLQKGQRLVQVRPRRRLRPRAARKSTHSRHPAGQWHGHHIGLARPCLRKLCMSHVVKDGAEGRNSGTACRGAAEMRCGRSAAGGGADGDGERGRLRESCL